MSAYAVCALFLWNRLYPALYFGTTLASERTCYDERIGKAYTSKDTMSDRYRFHVEGHLDDTWSDWLGDILIQHQHDGTTMFTQVIPDQSALYGVLFKLANTGVSLIAVQRIYITGEDNNDQ